MKAYELIEILYEGMKRMSEVGIKMEDYKHLPMYLEYNELVAKDVKKEYIKAKLARKYKMSERTVFRVIARLGEYVRT